MNAFPVGGRGKVTCVLTACAQAPADQAKGSLGADTLGLGGHLPS